MHLSCKHKCVRQSREQQLAKPKRSGLTPLNQQNYYSVPVLCAQVQTGSNHFLSTILALPQSTGVTPLLAQWTNSDNRQIGLMTTDSSWDNSPLSEHMTQTDTMLPLAATIATPKTGMSWCKAARRDSVLRSTLQGHKKACKDNGRPQLPPKAFKDLLVAYCQEMASKGFGLSRGKHRIQ